MMNRVLPAILLLGFAAVFTACGVVQPTDPLPSWSEGETKTAITRFVTNVTTEGSPDFVPSAQRIAAFDNDGTLWSEQPVVQLEFITYQIKKMSGKHPEWKTQEPYKAVLEGDKEYLINDITKNHGKGLQEMVLAAHAGMTIQEFNEAVREFFNTEQHPKFKTKFIPRRPISRCWNCWRIFVIMDSKLISVPVVALTL